MASSEVKALKEERERLRREHAAGAPGLATARGLAAAVEAAVRGVWGRIANGGGASLLALGELARGTLSPFSEVELCVLHAPGLDPTPAVKELSFELWAAGVELGVAVFTPEEALAAARERPPREVAVRGARLLAGGPGPFDELRLGLEGTAETFPARLREAVAERRLGGEDATCAVEPDLRAGRGGLEDLAAVALAGVDGGPARCEEEAGLLHRVRHELHYLAGRNTDLLLVEHREPVAEALLGTADGAAEVALMRSLYAGCRRIAAVLDGLLFPETREPEAAARLAAALAGRWAGPWPPEALRALTDMLAAGAGGRAAFDALDGSGDLVRAIPEWESIRCLPERGAYHRRCVDVHCLETAAAAAGLDAVLDPGDRETLLLAAFLHDIGKGTEEDHTVRGEALARAALERMGVGEPAASDAAWLVRNHLLLALTATRRDIGDERLVLDLADQIGSERRLALLHLITVADGSATGPGAWTAWKATLVARLARRIGRVLERGELAGPDVSGLARARLEEVRAALAGLPRAAVEAHLAGMPRQWLLFQPPEALVAQSAMMIEFAPAQDLVLSPVPVAGAGIWEVTVVARDRPGLFSKVSGALALHGLNVLGAQAFTREDGVALEVFRVEALASEEERFEHVAEDARKALRGRISLDARLAEKRRAGSRPGAARYGPPKVVVDNESSDFFTVVEVHAIDRVGLLYSITRALAELELDIHLAKVSTSAEKVVDVFYLRDLDGQKVTDPEFVWEIERTVLHRLTAL